MRAGYFAVAIGILVLFAQFVVDNYGADKRKKVAETVTVNALGPVNQTSGWCDDVDDTAAVSVWDSTNVPAELDDQSQAHLLNRRSVRYFVVMNSTSGTALCARLGTEGTDFAAIDAGPDAGPVPVTDRDVLQCDSTSTNGSLLRSQDSGRSYHVENDPAFGDVPDLFVRAASGTVRYCVEVGWHS